MRVEYEYAEEIEYLEWFFSNADFGPAHEDVIIAMECEFRENVGKMVPQAYQSYGGVE